MSDIKFHKDQKLYLVENDTIRVLFCESDNNILPLDLRTYFYPEYSLSRSKIFRGLWQDQYNVTWFDSFESAKIKLLNDLSENFDRIKLRALEAETKIVVAAMLREENLK